MHPRPCRLAQTLPAAERAETPFQHPFRLTLLGRDIADGIFAQPLGRAFHLDVGDEAVFVLVAELGHFLAGLDSSHLCRLPAHGHAFAIKPWTTRCNRVSIDVQQTSLEFASEADAQRPSARAAFRIRPSPPTHAMVKLFRTNTPRAGTFDAHAVEVQRHQRAFGDAFLGMAKQDVFDWRSAPFAKITASGAMSGEKLRMPDEIVAKFDRCRI